MTWLYALSDPRDPWCGDDKLAHFFGAAFTKCKAPELLARWFGLGPAWAWVAVVLLILLVEAIELARWTRWQAKGGPMPWPWLCDKVSPKDIGWGLLGAWMATW